jgi:SAM-dependent methyltransferase
VDAYVEAFERFQSATDEKEVLARELTGEIQQLAAQSLLDIGAGSGQLALRLAQAVSEYVALDERPEYVRQLSTLGLTAVLGRWPMTIRRRFDIVLMSHVLAPGDPLRQMLETAFGNLKPGGALLLVLHDVVGSDWAELLKHLTIDHEDQAALPNRVLKVLADLGARTETRQITTHLHAADMDAMLDALSFVATSGKPHRQEPFFAGRDKIAARFNDSYRDADGGYRFVFQHLLVSATPGPNVEVRKRR